MSQHGWRFGYLLASMVFVWSCTTSKPIKPPTLTAPFGTKPTALAAMQEGDRLFASGRWGAAKDQYESALKAQPDLAEAHYNLALTLDRMGNRQEARPHYMEAANLAPGHPIIWNSPVLRRYGDVKVEPKSQNQSAPVLPSLGGIGGAGGGPPGGY